MPSFPGRHIGLYNFPVSNQEGGTGAARISHKKTETESGKWKIANRGRPISISSSGGIGVSAIDYISAYREMGKDCDVRNEEEAAQIDSHYLTR